MSLETDRLAGMAALPPLAGEQPVEASNGHARPAAKSQEELAPVSFYSVAPPAKVYPFLGHSVYTLLPSSSG